MGAGDGAAEQSRLAAERAQRLKRQLDQAERATKPWDAGAVGERLVADRLSRLIPHGWYLLNDVHWPGRPKANLDHVLVGPGGVVVVDAKNWTGEVRVSGGVLWQGRFARTQSVDGALAQCAAVASVLAPPHRRFVRPLICLAGQPDLFGITNSDVAVAGADRVVAAVLALPPVLHQQTVVGLYAHLGEQLTQESAARRPAVNSLTVKSPTAKPLTSKLAAGQAGGVGSGRARKSSAQHHAAGGLTRLVFLAAFVVFAVYVLPYWGR
ncbi:nuclease-related domain-containing protein [Pseudarthrobacter sp. AB1]|uniref:nuclease-related domain-containing protein n=1 Tax=Pseudarthrobacter sp. AB1 TaxID=2138309 RepID=UPI00186B8B88|nr:nuclease-related domain-containing protein [Pseudarthrobacter sp. AB1]MBE4717970.1 NERD nuclease [Pseudarthrobacter sp. AB1]